MTHEGAGVEAGEPEVLQQCLVEICEPEGRREICASHRCRVRVGEVVPSWRQGMSTLNSTTQSVRAARVLRPEHDLWGQPFSGFFSIPVKLSLRCSVWDCRTEPLFIHILTPFVRLLHLGP